MNVLCLDLTVLPGTVALMSAGGISSKTLKDQRSQGTRILTEIDGLLTHAHMTMADVNEIWVVTGPGSFTGIRISLATALGLAKPHIIPVMGVSALDVMACKAFMNKCDTPLCVYQKSHQGDYFCHVWANASSSDKPYQGDVNTACATIITRDLGNAEKFDTLSVSARDVLMLRDALLAGNFASDPEPFYIRPPDVTIARKHPHNKAKP